MDFSRKLPIGIQDFEKLRTNNFIYVDKTAYIYEIDDKGYLIPYSADERKTVKIGAEFSRTERTLSRWISL
jgi:hypothetical protein